jgi:hypothetical protein
VTQHLSEEALATQRHAWWKDSIDMYADALIATSRKMSRSMGSSKRNLSPRTE